MREISVGEATPTGGLPAFSTVGPTGASLAGSRAGSRTGRDCPIRGAGLPRYDGVVIRIFHTPTTVRARTAE
jgi:hypothetical protein